MLTRQGAPAGTAAVIRQAGKNDVPAMVGLLAQLFALEPDFVFDPERQKEGLRLMLGADPSRRVWVAKVGRRVVGMCTAQTIISTAEGGEAAVIEDVVVDRMFRHRGIGRELLGAVDRWARRRGIRRLQLLADRWNSSALNFYSHQSWLPTRLVCLRRVVRRD